MYLITCQTCRHQYVGQTRNSLASRFQQHLLSIDHCTDWSNSPRSAIEQGSTNVGLHFSAHDNPKQVLLIEVLEFVKFSPQNTEAKAFRENIEQHMDVQTQISGPFRHKMPWMVQITANTVPIGLDRPPPQHPAVSGSTYPRLA